jgi:hypothetical protein
MSGRPSFPAAIIAVAALAGCHGPPIHEVTPDGGGGSGGGAGGTTGTAGSSAGASGGAGRGGTNGGGTGGTSGSGGTSSGGTSSGGSGGSGGRGGSGGGSGGAGCAAQMQPVMFHQAQSGPVSSDGTTYRYYWVEFGTPWITFHYTDGTAVHDNTHPLQIDASVANTYNFAVDDMIVAATWNLQGKLAVYGPNVGSLQIGTTMTLTNPSAVTVRDGAVLYAYDPMGGNPTPGIYKLPQSAAPTLFESYANLGGDWTLGLMLRTTPSKLLLCDTTDVRMVDMTTKGAAPLLFDNPGNKTVLDVRPTRPHTSEGGVVVELDDTTFWKTGRDYYVDISRPGATPMDLATAVSTLADASACGAAAHYEGSGVLYLQRYVYEGQGGLFAVTVSTTGAVSNLVRLTDLALGYPEVTGVGDLFAVRYNETTSQWEYYRVGDL